MPVFMNIIIKLFGKTSNEWKFIVKNIRLALGEFERLI